MGPFLMNVDIGQAQIWYPGPLALEETAVSLNLFISKPFPDCLYTHGCNRNWQPISLSSLLYLVSKNAWCDLIMFCISQPPSSSYSALNTALQLRHGSNMTGKGKRRRAAIFRGSPASLAISSSAQSWHSKSGPWSSAKPRSSIFFLILRCCLLPGLREFSQSCYEIVFSPPTPSLCVSELGYSSSSSFLDWCSEGVSSERD